MNFVNPLLLKKAIGTILTVVGGWFIGTAVNSQLNFDPVMKIALGVVIVFVGLYLIAR